MSHKLTDHQWNVSSNNANNNNGVYSGHITAGSASIQPNFSHDEVLRVQRAADCQGISNGGFYNNKYGNYGVLPGGGLNQYQPQSAQQIQMGQMGHMAQMGPDATGGLSPSLFALLKQASQPRIESVQPVQPPWPAQHIVAPSNQIPRTAQSVAQSNIPTNAPPTQTPNIATTQTTHTPNLQFHDLFSRCGPGFEDNRTSPKPDAFTSNYGYLLMGFNPGFHDIRQGSPPRQFNHNSGNSGNSGNNTMNNGSSNNDIIMKQRKG